MTEAGNNYSEKKTQLHISVRNLVEFIFREGDIDNRSSRAMSADAMMEGTRIHRKIQGSMGKEYQAEVPLSLVVEGDLYELTVEGRADGIFTEDGKCFVDEIKGMYRKVELFEKPVFVHRAQAMCYAYIFALQNNMETIGIQMTYCNLETDRFFDSMSRNWSAQPSEARDRYPKTKLPAAWSQYFYCTLRYCQYCKFPKRHIPDRQSPFSMFFLCGNREAATKSLTVSAFAFLWQVPFAFHLRSETAVLHLLPLLLK